jgi:hypothetical protein
MYPKAVGRTSVLVRGVAVTASGLGVATHGLEGVSRCVAQLDVTAASGVSPTLDVVIEDSVDGINWNTVATFAQATAVVRSVQRITAPFTDRLRARYTLAGSAPSFDFTVQVYVES